VFDDSPSSRVFSTAWRPSRGRRSVTNAEDATVTWSSARFGVYLVLVDPGKTRGDLCSPAPEGGGGGGGGGRGVIEIGGK
jgi:hypothetical protein